MSKHAYNCAKVVENVRVYIFLNLLTRLFSDRRGIVTEDMMVESNKQNDSAHSRSQYGAVKSQPMVSLFIKFKF